MQNPFYDQKPDPLEKKIRFGCGFLFGLIFGFFGMLKASYRTMYGDDSIDEIIVNAVVIALACGGLALKYGDRFWREICRLRWW